jgi:hypothetical protein
VPSEYDEDHLQGAIEKVKLEIRRRKLEDLKEKITEISTLDPAQANEYLREYEKLIKEFGGKNG